MKQILPTENFFGIGVNRLQKLIKLTWYTKHDIKFGYLLKCGSEYRPKENEKTNIFYFIPSKKQPKKEKFQTS